MDLFEADHDNHSAIVWRSILDYVYFSQGKVRASPFLLMLIRYTDDVSDMARVPPLYDSRNVGPLKQPSFQRDVVQPATPPRSCTPLLL